MAQASRTITSEESYVDVAEPPQVHWGPADYLIGVFWDYENVKIPSGMDAAAASNKIRSKLQSIGQIHERRLYYDSRKTSEVNTDREGFAMTGCTLIDCPTRNRKETLDKQILVDMLMFVATAKGKSQIPCIVLISGDGDYAYCLQRARDIQCYTIVIYGGATAPCLLLAGDVCWNMRREVLGMGPVQRSIGPVGGMSAANVESPVAAFGGDLLESSATSPMLADDPPNRVERNISLSCAISNDGAYLSLCVAYRDLARQKSSRAWHKVWILGSELAQKYYVMSRAADNKHYKAMLQEAIDDGFLERGRRDMNAPAGRFIAPTIYADGTEPPGTQLAPETFVRATDNAVEESRRRSSHAIASVWTTD